MSHFRPDEIENRLGRAGGQPAPKLQARPTAPWIESQKGTRKLVCITAYDEPSARLADLAGVDLILVGDSVGNVVLGFADTLPVTLEMMIHHTAAAARAKTRALLVADMPFGSYGASVEQAVQSAVQLVKAGAEAVKLEGAYFEEIRAIKKVGIPVLGHLGMTPQSKNNFGGFKPQGKSAAGAQQLEKDLIGLEEAGVFATVLELIPEGLASHLTEVSRKPTIGIGAGPHCDGQIQVWHDLLGIGEFQPKHAKRYAELGQLMTAAIECYGSDVRSGRFGEPSARVNCDPPEATFSPS